MFLRKQQTLTLSNKVDLEKDEDKICPSCGRIMSLERKIKGRHYKSPVDLYKCVCGYEVRKRTYKEILRDLGEVE